MSGIAPMSGIERGGAASAKPLIRGAAAIALFLLAGATGFGQDATVVYLEGSPTIRPASGSRFPADFGERVQVGDSVLTGARDFLEMEQGTASTIRVQPDTVFTVQQRESDEGERETVMRATVGAVRFRFNRIVTEQEPMVGSATTIAGVRGTELTVYAGGDGTSLYLVEEGQVDVEADNETVSLGPNEAVQVSAAGRAGEKHEWPGRELDFSRWNQDRMDAFLETPVESARRIRERLTDFEEQIRRLYPEYLELSTNLRNARDELAEMEEEGEASQEELQQFVDEEIVPLRTRTARIFLNIRYYALSAHSLKGHVLGRMYLEMKARNFLTPENETYQSFLEVYNAIQADFEEFVAPRLVPDDI